MGERWQEIARELGAEDSSLGGPPRLWVEAEPACKLIAELQDRIAELEAALGQTKAEAHKGFEAYENLLEERWQEIARELRAQQARAELSEAAEKRAVQAWKDEQANARRLFAALEKLGFHETAWCLLDPPCGTCNACKARTLLDELRASYGGTT